MAPTLNILVTCSNRKRIPAPEQLRLGRLREAPLERRCALWVRGLERVEAPSLPAWRMYQGEHWQVAQELPRIVRARGGQASMWICSAGYGLIQEDAHIKPYQATLTIGHADAVAGARMQVSRWWHELAGWAGPEGRGPRTIAQLAASRPRESFLVVASGAYLAALENDLLQAAEQLDDPESLLILSASAQPKGGLGPHLLPADSRLQRLVGGARQALNVRIARLLLNSLGPAELGLARASRFLAGLLEEQPPPRGRHRRPLDDAEVIAFIRRQLERQPELSKTPLLRRLRQEGQACEQGRFGRLYLQAKRQEHA